MDKRALDRARATWAAALAEAMRERGWEQPDVAKRMGITQQSVSSWLRGFPPDSPWRNFEIERRLGLPDGYLSHHLGFIPVDGSMVPEAIAKDPQLNDAKRKMLLSMYRALVALKE